MKLWTFTSKSLSATFKGSSSDSSLGIFFFFSLFSGKATSTSISSLSISPFHEPVCSFLHTTEVPHTFLKLILWSHLPNNVQSGGPSH
ncbi:Hypothetical protein FKW44_014230 [Caligus rogercresseyi]|uniref:Uncharacterized protein n=1 Tax=Caligus rogercresseyi TaxID=217165 RepID=A0A7T8GZ84_CALRO|nr:Hypothetical protein FKW44_014230 [Caligus rogercresseyi]